MAVFTILIANVLLTAHVVDLLVAMATATSAGKHVTLVVDVTTYVTRAAGAP